MAVIPNDQGKYEVYCNQCMAKLYEIDTSQYNKNHRMYDYCECENCKGK